MDDRFFNGIIGCHARVCGVSLTDLSPWHITLLHAIDSPMVGTYYSAPSPESAPFIKVGDTIKKGQAVAVLEAMKIMNELEAEFDCKIVEILVQDGQAVEYDMPLFVVEKI